MKILYLLFFLIGFSTFVLSAQDVKHDHIKDEEDNQEFTLYNYNLMHCEKPLFPGGYSNFITTLNQNTHYSQSIADTLEEDVHVIARITLDNTGQIIKREAWSKYNFFQDDVLDILDQLPNFNAPSKIENCEYEIHLKFTYKTYNLVPDCFSQDFKMYDEDTLYREKPQFPGGYQNFLRLLKKYTHYSKSIAEDLSKNINVLARISLDSTGRITDHYVWSESQFFREKIMYFLKNLPAFEGPSQIMDCDIQLNFIFEKSHPFSLDDPSVIYIFPQESNEFERYLKSIKDFDIRF